MTLLEVIKEIKRLEQIATKEKFTLKADCKYEWELGADVYRIISEGLHVYINECRAENIVLMGFPFRINYENKSIIKLWKEVG